MAQLRARSTSAAPRSAVAAAIALMIVLAATSASAQEHYRRSGPAGEPAAGTPADRTPQPLEAPPYQFSGDEVRIPVGQSIQAAVDAHPPGTHFRIAAGVHRLQQVAPRDGMTFTGEPGAVLSGAAVLEATAFRAVDGRWVIGGQTAEPVITGSVEEGHDRHAANHDLFLDGQLADHVSSRSAVQAPGQWFFDYDADEVVLFDDPTAFAAVELSLARSAFESAASDVTIQHLTITRYASPSQVGAIHGNRGRSWEVAHVTVAQNHGVGVRIGPGMHLHRSRIIANGQLGVGGADVADGVQLPVVVEHNEIAGNKTLRFRWAWEGGATKFVLSRNLVFQHNWVHHNAGPGIWYDIDNVDAVIRSNVVEHNAEAGVLYEISYGATIQDNIIRHNGAETYGDLGAGVHVSNSRDVEVTRNAIYGNRSAVMAVNHDRGSGAHGVYEVTGLHVHRNDISPGEVPTGLRVYHGDRQHYYHGAGNRFEANTYRVDPAAITFWAEGHLDLAGWQRRGHDATATVEPASSTPVLPAPGVVFQDVAIGPST